jgi:transposase-like protein
LAIEYCHACRRAHQPFSEIAEALGISTVTLGRWLEKDRADSSSRFREVVVEPVVPKAAEAQLAVVTPSGLRVEGLELSQVIELSRALQ